MFSGFYLLNNMLPSRHLLVHIWIASSIHRFPFLPLHCICYFTIDLQVQKTLLMRNYPDLCLKVAQTEHNQEHSNLYFGVCKLSLSVTQKLSRTMLSSCCNYSHHTKKQLFGHTNTIPTKLLPYLPDLAPAK